MAGDAEQIRAQLFEQHAYLYAGLGWTLLQLNGKRPRRRDWEKTPFDQAELAAGKWAHWGRRSNMGVMLAGSRLAVVEPDTPEAHARLLDLVGGELPAVPTVQSGGKSLHLYFADGGQGNAERDGLELRAGGQQCVLPPSVHPDTGRSYVWLPGRAPWDVAPVPLPQVLLDYFNTGGRRNGQPVAVGAEIREPGRHRALLSLAGTMRRRGMGEPEIAAALLVLNKERCRPPLPASEVQDLVADVVSRYQPVLDVVQQQLDEQADRLFAGDEQPAGPVSRRKPKAKLLRRPLSAVISRPVEWLIENLIPVGTSTLLAGVGGLGKSALALAYAKRVTDRGGNVLIVSYEDAAEQVLRPRFEALGGNLELVHELYVDMVDGGISFPADLPDLERHVQDTDARMVLVDPVSASVDLKLDAHRDQDVRVVLGQLAALASRAELSPLLLAHLNKTPSSDPYLRINGSTAFYNAARSVLTVTRDPEEPDWHRLVAHHKSNYGPLAPVERWRVIPKTIIATGGLIDVMTMEFVEVADGVSHNDVLASRPATVERLEDAIEFLTDALRDGDWHDSAGLKTLAGAQRIAERTLKRAAQELDAEHERRGFPSSTWWRLPQLGQPLTPNLGPTGETRINTGEVAHEQSSWANVLGEDATGVAGPAAGQAGP